MPAGNLKSLDGLFFGRDPLGFMRAKIGFKAPALSIGAAGSEVAVDVEGMTSITAMTTASTGDITSRGITTLSSAAKDYTIGNPVVGVRKTLTTVTTSTLARTVTRNSTAFYFQSTDGSTMVKASFASGGGVLELIGLSTALYGVIGRLSTDTVLSGTS